MKRLTGFIVVTLLFLLPLRASAVPGLGISLSIDQASQTEAELSGEIWVGLQQGETATRTLNIKSLSDDTEQQIDLALFDLIQVDGVTKTDYSKPSRFSEWVSFTPAVPVVPAGEQIAVVMEFDIPADAQDEAFQAVLNVAASSVEDVGVVEGSGAQAVIKTRLAVETKVWLGVGDALDLTANYEIASIDGGLLNNQKFVRIYFENIGIVPILLKGRVQLSDPAFAERVFEPIDFESPEILAGASGFVDVPVTNDLVDGFYRAFVTAESGGVRKTKLFEGNLVFDDPNLLTLPDLAWRFALFALAGVGLVFGIRLLRRKSNTDEIIEQPPEDVRPTRKSSPGGSKTTESQSSEKSRTVRTVSTKRTSTVKSNNADSPVTAPPASKGKLQSEAASKKADQRGRTTRKTAPASPRTSSQSGDTESK